MTTPITTNATDSQMHNNIMAASSKERPPMLAPGRYAQWRSRFMRYIDTKPNGEALNKCITEGPYEPSTVIIPAQPAIENSPAVAEVLEDLTNMSTANKAHYQAEKEAIHMLLTRIGDEIYSTIDACKTAHEIHKGKEIAKPITPPFESASEEDIDPEQAQKDKEMQKNLALFAKYFKKLYKPTNNNLITSSNSRNKNVDTTLRYVNENQTGQFGNKRIVIVVGARETVGIQVVQQQTRIQCYNCKEFGHFAKECRKPKRTKDYTYHKEKMLLCKQAEKGVPLQTEQVDWLEDTNEEVDEQYLVAHYSFMEKIQEVLPADLGSDDELLKKVQYDVEYNVFANEREHSEQPNTHIVEMDDSNVIPDSLNMCDHDNQADQNAEECNDGHVALANLIAKLTLDNEENKKILKQLKKASLTQELKECKTTRALGESNSTRDGCLIAFENQKIEIEKYKTYLNRTTEYDTLERKLKETQTVLAQKENDIQDGLKLKAYEIYVVKKEHDELVKHSLLTKSSYEGLVKEKNKVIKDLNLKEENDIDKLLRWEKQITPKAKLIMVRPTFSNPMYLKKAQSEKPCLYEIPYDTSDLANKFSHDREETLTLDQEKTCLMPLALKAQNDSFQFVHEREQEMFADLQYVQSLEKEIDELKSDKANFTRIYDLLLQECVSKDVILANELSKQKDKVFKDVYIELLRSFAKLEKHSISLELKLQQCQEQMNDIVCKQNRSIVFLKEREQYHEIQDLKAHLQDKHIAISELKKLIEKFKGKYVETKFDKPSVIRQPNALRIPKPSMLGKSTTFSDSLERKSVSKTKSVPKMNVSEGLSKPVTIQTLPQTARQAVRNTNVIKQDMYRIDTRTTQTRAPQLPQNSRNSTGVIYKTSLSRTQLKITQLNDKVMQNNSQVKSKKKEVEDHHRISSISNKTKSVTACNDSLKSRTSNVNAVCATCGKCVFNSNHDACVSKLLNDVNARTNKPKVVPISTRKPKSQASKSVATPHKKTVASDPTI
ncbi:integrase, catalytic region, zinc finger, CCHC-type containing protein [Tanacetum coccineum]